MEQPAPMGESISALPVGIAANASLRLLLIDDNPHDRELLARGLRQRFGALHIEPVRDAHEFEEALRGNAFDAAVVDYELGWSTGIEVFRQIRRVCPQCPVLMFTASGSEEVAVQAMKEGLSDYITKTAKHYARLPYALEAALERVAQRRALQFAESARAQLAGEVHMGQLRLGLALRAAGMMAWEHELETGRIQVSANAEDIVGARWNTFSEVVAAIHEADLPAFHRACESSRESGEAFACVVRIRLPDSESERWLELRGQPFRDTNGALTRVLGVALDVTERKRAEAELLEADRRKDAFVATLAHELRNPLAPIRYAARLMEPEVSVQIVTDARQVMDRQLAHMARLLDDLLDVSRITRGVLQIRHDLVDLREAIDTAVSATRPLAAQAHRTLSVRVPDGPLPVRGDSERLAQIIGNLLSNALRYTDPGGHIELEASGEANLQVVVRVRDDGIGISEEILGKVFDLFVQGEPGSRRASDGLGIGLALARDLVKLHDGQLEVRSAGPGCGSEFVLRLPQSTEKPAVVVPAVKRRGPVPGASNLCVLVVDDNEDAADTLGILLGLAGFRTEIAYDPSGALETAARTQPAVALLDIGLPSMSGHELAREMRRQPWGADICLIAISGWGQEEDRRKSSAAGFDHHLTKPVDPDELIQLIAQRVRTSAPEAPTRP